MPGRPLRILSLDGGGVRGISSLYILKDIMEQISRQRCKDHQNQLMSPPRPCEIFDLICGTSTGGLIALMLGRLEMDVDNTIERYHSLVEKIFTSKSKRVEAKFDHDVFEQQVKEVIKNAGLDSSSLMHNSKPNACKTFVVAVNTLASGMPVLIRSYDDFPTFDCMIWQAARATTAAPTFFIPITINGIKYSDGGTGFNNPAELSIDEAKRIWPNRSITCLVSIGTGQRGPIQLESEPKSFFQKTLSYFFPSWSFKINVAEWCVRLLTSSHTKHLELLKKLNVNQNYFRFDVSQGMSNIGLDEWKKLGLLIALTQNYMDNEMLKEKEHLAKLLLNSSFVETPIETDSYPNPHYGFGAHSVYKPILSWDQAPKRTNCFVDRQQTSLASIFEQLEKNKHLVITGFPGVGKTELAIQVFDGLMAENKYKGYFWVNASTESSFKSGLFEMARAFNVIDECENIDDIRRNVLNVLNTEDKWLMVLDNVDNFDLIERFCALGHGQRHIIITARRSRYSIFNSWEVQLDLMRENEAIELFLKTYSYSRNLPEMETDREHSVRSLVQMLGLHPLAIIQAAAYLRAHQDTIGSYIVMYRDKKNELLQWKPFDEEDYVSFLTTIVLSLSKLKNNVHTVQLLCAISFLHSDNIPLSLCKGLSDSHQTRSQGSEALSSCKYALNSALEPLIACSFIKRVSNESISIHRLAQDAIRAVIEGSVKDTSEFLQSLNPGERTLKYWVERAVNRIQMAYPTFSSPDTWRECDLYTPHAESCMRYAKDLLTTEPLSKLKRAVASHLYSFGDFERAEMLRVEALAINKKIFGFESIETAITLTEVAEALVQRAYDDYAIYYFNEALRVYQTLYERANTSPEERLQIYRKMAIAIHGRANVYNLVGWYGQAVKQFTLALEMKETIRNSKLKVNITNTLNGLANAYSRQGDYEKARKLYEKSLFYHQTEPSLNRIAEAHTHNHMGNLNSQCNFNTSLRHYHIALSIYDEQYGVDHILSTKPLNGIGNIFVVLGRYEEGIQHYKRLLRIKEALYGKNSLASANTINNLGNAFDSLGKIIQAKVQYDLALTIYKTELGPDHSKSTLALRNRGNIELYYGNYENALDFYNRAMKSFSREDPMVLAKLWINLASISSHLGNHDLALNQCNQAIEGIACFGEHNITFAMAISSRGDIYCGQKKFSEAMKDYEQALKIYESILGRDYVQSMEIIVRIGNVYHSLSRCTEAIERFELAYNFYKKVFGKDHVNTGPVIRNIGCALKEQGYCDRAKEQYIHAIMVYQKALEDKADGVTDNLIKLSLKELEDKLQIYERKVGKAHYSWPDSLST